MVNPKNRLWIRLGLCIYAIVYGIQWPLMHGVELSYSSYYAIAPTGFTLTTLLVSLGLWLHRSKEWEMPAMALMVVAAFNCYEWPMVHNIAAMAFFMSSTYMMIRDKRYGAWGKISLAWYAMLLLMKDGGLFWFEAIQIILIATYHMRRVIHLMKLHNAK